MFNRMSIKTKTILLSSFGVVLLGLTLIISSFFIQGQVLNAQLRESAQQVVERWAHDIDPEEVMQAKNTPDRNSEIQKKFTEYFDTLSKYHPDIAQGYIFGTELEDGNKTTNIAFPTHVLEMFDEVGLKLGDLFEQPQEIAKRVREMLDTKSVTFSDIYSDDFGTWMTVLYPITDSEGNIFAYFGVDVDASMVKEGQIKLLAWTSVFLFAVLAIIIAIQYFNMQRVMAPIQELMTAIDNVSKGNFDVKLKGGNDELGQIINKFSEMTGNIKNLIAAIKQVAKESANQSQYLSNAVEENFASAESIAQSVNEVASQMQQQSASTTESAHSLESIAASVEAIADNASDVAQTSLRMKEQSEQGNELVHKVIDQMNRINESARHSAAVMDKLQTRSQEISNIVQMISNIANQTNLLALNAAIEAAHAGEHGRGFAVVAAEVRKLAEQSKDSAEQIAQLIDAIQAETAEAVSVTDQGVQNIQIGVELAEQTGKLFGMILQAAEEVTSQIQEVSAATQQMAAESEEVSSSMRQLSEIADHNSRAVENINENVKAQQQSFQRIAESAQQLSNMSKEMESLLSTLKFE